MPDRATVLELDVVSAVMRRAIPTLQVLGIKKDEHLLALGFERHPVLVTSGQVLIRDARLAVKLGLR